MKRNSSSTMDSSSRIGPNGSSSNGPSMQITSDEVNFLIFRYLQEAGFVHSAFTFINESMISRSNISRSDIPPGALISFLQKGLQYIGIEETIRQDGSDRQREKSKTSKHSNNTSGGSGSTSNSTTSTSTTDNHNEIIDFSLLSPHAIKALIRRDAPIKLNVPPEAAVAAIRAKIEAESRALETKAHTRPSQTNGPLTTPQSTRQSSNRNKSSNNNQHHHSNNNNSSNATPTLDKQRSSKWAQNNRDKQQAAQAMAMMNQQQLQPIPSNRLTSNGYEIGESSNAAANEKAAAAQALASVAQRAVHDTTDSNRNVAASMNMTNNHSNNSNNNNLFNASNNHISTTDAAKVLASNMQLTQEDMRRTALTQQQENEVEKADLLTRARPDEVMELNKHTSEVFMCAWNPVYTNLLATGSGDASARIWEMGSKNSQSRLLPHGNNSTDKKNKDVTTLEWSSDGELLATGSYDGVARVWRKDGSIIHTLKGHMGPIFSLKWNKKGNFLLSGSYDKTTIVWDVWEKEGKIKQQFHNHTAPALDVDWKNDDTFASCSTDKSVLICKVGQTAPLFKFTGHKDEVNAVKWDPSGTLLASCSDDYTAKVWNISSSSNQPLYDFKSHKQEIYTVKWSPTGPGSKNPNKPLMLATASFDGSVRLWDVKDGSCISVLSRHRDSVYSVSFSPSGEYLASGSLAGQLYIWRVRDGQHVKNFKGKGDIFEVAWNVEETRVAACFSSNVVNVIDFRP